MGLIRYLLLLALITLVGWLVRRALSVIWQRLTDRLAASADKVADTEQIHTVRCAECGLFLPATQALESQGRYYCQEHQRPRA